MPIIRFSIAGLMMIVLIAAVGLVGLRMATPTWAGAVLLATCGILALTVVGAVCRGAVERAWWLGCVLFGWGYLGLAFGSPVSALNLPTVTGLELVWTKAGMNVPRVPPGRPMAGATDPSFAQIGHCLWALIGATLGGILASALFSIPSLRPSTRVSDSRDGDLSPRKWWRRPAVLGLSGLAIAGLTAVIGSPFAADVWAGVSFLLTCGLLAIAGLAAVVGRGRSREIWLGVTLFGWGYMILAFGWHPFHDACPYLVTGHLLNAIRPSFPPKVGGFPPCDDREEPTNARILRLLDEPVPIRYRTETPLEKVLVDLKAATLALDGKGIPIFVDPIGLQEAEKSMTSTVRFDIEGVPLKNSLHICLQQLGLVYRIKDGFLQITSDTDDEAELLPIAENPFVIVGHSLLALLAAGLGGCVAPIVAGERRLS